MYLFSFYHFETGFLGLAMTSPALRLGLASSDSPASSSQVPGLKVCAKTTWLMPIFLQSRKEVHKEPKVLTCCCALIMILFSTAQVCVHLVLSCCHRIGSCRRYSLAAESVMLAPTLSGCC